MRSGIAILCFCFVAGAAEIPAGAHVALQLVNAVDTRTAQVGDYVYLRTASPIAAGGQILVPVGSYVQAAVSRARRSGRVRAARRAGHPHRNPHFPGRQGNPHQSALELGGLRRFGSESGCRARATSSRPRATMRMPSGWPQRPAPERPSAAWRSGPGPPPESVAQPVRASAWPSCSSPAARKWHCARAPPSTWSSIAPFRWTNRCLARKAFEAHFRKPGTRTLMAVFPRSHSRSRWVPVVNCVVIGLLLLGGWRGTNAVLIGVLAWASLSNGAVVLPARCSMWFRLYQPSTGGGATEKTRSRWRIG